MPGSFTLATVFRIPIRIHLTLAIAFLLLVLQLGLFGIPAGILLFASVFAHELGHAVVAQAFGIRIAAIDLHVLGGTAVMTESPTKPRQEIIIAAAGPAVSFALAAVFFVAATLLGASFTLAAPSLVELVGYAAMANLAMGVFNLIPALPMDGGRIFRAALTPTQGAVRATRIAATVARVFAVLFVVVGLLWGGWSLMLIGAFVYMLAGREEQLVRARQTWPVVPPDRVRPWWRSGSDFAPAYSGARETVVDMPPRPSRRPRS